MNNHLIITFVVAVIVSTATTGVNSLHCYQCLALECNGEEDLCTDVRSFMVDNLKKYYDMPSTIEDCPEDLDDVAWFNLHQADAHPCPGKDSVCAVERVEILTTKGDFGTPIFKGSASVLGCGSSDLHERMKDTNSHSCNITKRVGSYRYPAVQHHLRMEHCRTPATECRDTDWCVDPTQMENKPFRTPGLNSGKASLLTIIIGIGVFSAVVFLAWGACHFYNYSTLKISNIPKTPFEDSESVIVVTNRSTSSRYENIQEDQPPSQNNEEGINILTNQNSTS